MSVNNSEELSSIMAKFAESGWDLIDESAKAWLGGKKNNEELIPVMEQANQECGSCGCEMDPLYKRALVLLNA